MAVNEDLDQDFSEATDVSAEHPDTVRALQELWFVEAGRNNVVPLSEGLLDRAGAMIQRDYPVGNRATFDPEGSPISDEAIPRLMGGFVITADLDVSTEGAEGVVFALGDWNGGYALFATEGVLRFAFCPYGEQMIATAAQPTTAGRHQVAVGFVAAAGTGGTFTLAVDGEPVGSSSTGLPMPFAFQHGGSHLCIGYDRGFPVCDDYTPPFPWQGTIHSVTFETAGVLVDRVDEHVQTAMGSD